MIPKKIHYCWFGGAPLPQDVQACIRSWKKYCPDYEIIRWDESNYDVTGHPFMKAAYEAKSWAFVSDYARLDVIYKHGGIYLDTDVELLKSLDGVRENGCYFGLQQSPLVVATGLGFGGEAGHPALKKMLEEYDEAEFSPERKEALACPILNTRALEKLGYVPSRQVVTVADVRVYPPQFFDPLAPGDTEDLTCEDTVSVHHYSATWTSPGQQLKRKLINLIGQKWIVRLKGALKWKRS